MVTGTLLVVVGLAAVEPVASAVAIAVVAGDIAAFVVGIVGIEQMAAVVVVVAVVGLVELVATVVSTAVGVVAVEFALLVAANNKILI